MNSCITQMRSASVPPLEARDRCVNYNTTVMVFQRGHTKSFSMYTNSFSIYTNSFSIYTNTFSIYTNSFVYILILFYWYTYSVYFAYLYYTKCK
jgi:hypothetical protein